MIELASPYAGKFHLDFSYHHHYFRGRLSSSSYTPLMAVVLRPAYPEQSADSADTYEFFFSILTDCSGKEFFRISILYSFSAMSIIMSKSSAFMSFSSSSFSKRAFIRSNNFIFCCNSKQLLGLTLFHMTVIFISGVKVTIFFNPTSNS